MTTRSTLGPTARWIGVCFIGAAAIGGTPSRASAQNLVVTPQTISFPSSDPDTVPVISAPPVRVTYLGQGPTGGPWTITVRAGGELLSGASTIPISNVSWLATPSPPFRNGTLSTVAQTIATGAGTARQEQGEVTFRFANSWNYTVGTYTQTITFTLSSP